MNKKLLLFILLFIAIPYFSNAADTGIRTIANNIQQIMIYIGSVCIGIGWSIAGIIYLTSIGKPEKMQTGQRAIIAAIIGTIMILFAGATINVFLLLQNALLHGT